jgi:nucleotide-binding universal stress UspA family protein
MKELVVGIDGSDDSRMALRWAGAAADAAGVRVRALQSWTHPSSAALPLTPTPLSVEETDEKTLEAVNEVVAETLGASTKVITGVLRGPPAGALLQAVGPERVLVLGCRGRGGFAGLLLGSVSQECVEYASCPVVVVRTDRIVADGDVILVGKDGSEGAQRALVWAHALAGFTGAELHAVYAWRSDVSERPPRVGERLRSQAASTVQGWTQQLDDEVESHEVEGDPRQVLATVGDRIAPALTVVGRRGAGGLRSMRLGSTANHLIRHSATNVAVVPDPST